MRMSITSEVHVERLSPRQIAVYSYFLLPTLFSSSREVYDWDVSGDAKSDCAVQQHTWECRTRLKQQRSAVANCWAFEAPFLRDRMRHIFPTRLAYNGR